ncbi:MAG: prenyltransferase/squalene oxidase repeat-containing protein [Planctomycetota bacterium]
MTCRLVLLLALAASQAHAAPQAVHASEEPRDPAAPSSPAEPPAIDVRRATEEAVGWLLEKQKPRGCWGSFETRRVSEVLASVPGSHHAFRVATTALCVIALSDSPFQPPAARRAIDKGIDYLLEHYAVQRPNGMELYNVWAFGYTLQCFGEHLVKHPDDQRAAALREACRRLIDKVALYQCLDGGWGYYDFNAQTLHPSFTSMSFTTATVLVGLDRAQRAGVELPPRVIERALTLLERARTPAGTFVYDDALRLVPRMGINQAKGAACRTPLCQYALELFGKTVKTSDKVNALEELLVRQTRFQKIASRRPIPHEAWYQISGYFYLYGHAYAAYALERQPAEVQHRLWPALFRSLLHCRQPEGSFWDYPLYSYSKEYGTAFALIALSRIPQE